MARICNGDQTTIDIPAYADGEIPFGELNSSNVTYTLVNTPNPSTSLQIFYNGGLQDVTKYTLNTNTIILTFPPQLGDTLVAYYRY